jgi:hypothetical protein
MILRPKSQNRQPWFWGPNQKIVAVVLRPNHYQTVANGFKAELENPCFSSPPHVWYGSHMASPDLLIVYTKSPIPASILVATCHVAFTTYTSQDKQTRFSIPNILIWVSSTEMRKIQIQSRTSQLLITHIDQGTNHLVSQSPPWWVHWQLQLRKVWISNSRPIEDN